MSQETYEPKQTDTSIRVWHPQARLHTDLLCSYLAVTSGGNSIQVLSAVMKKP